MGQGPALSYSSAPRQSGLYAQVGDDTFRASGVNGDPSAVVLSWRGAPGTAPADFAVNETGTAGTRRDLRMSDLDRLYRLTVTCDYRGGGPFLVTRVDRQPDGTVTLQVTYTGSDRDWALAQPGIRSLDAARAMREPDVVGVIPFADAGALHEQVEELEPSGRTS